MKDDKHNLNPAINMRIYDIFMCKSIYEAFLFHKNKHICKCPTYLSHIKLCVTNLPLKMSLK